MITFPNVPIVGQPIEVVAVEVMALAYCNCQPEQKTLLRLIESRPALCPQCHAIYTLVGAVGGAPELDINVRKGKTNG